MHKYVIFSNLQELSTFNLLIYSVFDLCNRVFNFSIKKYVTPLIFGQLRIMKKKCYLENIQIVKHMFLSKIERFIYSFSRTWRNERIVWGVS
jgi:hypothetical protein